MTFGWRTLDVGEKALIYTAQGHARVEAGPKRLFLFQEKFIPLHSYMADQTEYLRVTYKNGSISHRSGPCAMFSNPAEVASICIMKGLSLDANEVLVVYRLDPKTQSVSKYIRHGPTIFIPSANEWFHEFEWHGTDPENKTRKIPHGLRFTKLQVIPDQFYYNVDEVRTADDALIRVKLMIFYELRDIEKMLSATSDPIADFINCTTADVVAFCSKLTYMEFIERSSQLNDLSNYPQLQERCRVIGYVVSKVGFRGYHASPTLQSMHDVAIMKRTELRAQFESEEQNQGMTDLLLQNDVQRMAAEQRMEITNLEHQLAIQKSEEQHKLSLVKEKCVENVRQKSQEVEADIQRLNAENEQKICFLSQLTELSVNLDEVISAENPVPDKVIRVVASDNAANLHIHQAAA